VWLHQCQGGDWMEVVSQLPAEEEANPAPPVEDVVVVVANSPAGEAIW